MAATPTGNTDFAPSQCTLQQAALGYAARGWYVYPCRPGSKIPAGKWKEGATVDPLQVIEWWTVQPDSNILIKCGVLSNLTVLDFDVKNGAPGEAAACEMLGDDWKARYSHVRTPSGGYHVYFVHIPEWGNGTGGPGLDVQGEGAYVLAPPSVIDGTVYQ